MQEVVARKRDPQRALAAEIVRENLKPMREAAGLTQQEAALLAGVSIDNLRRWESKGGIKTIEISALAKVYRRTVEEMTTKHSAGSIKPVDLPPVAYSAISGLSAAKMREVMELVAEAGGEFREIKMQRDADVAPSAPRSRKRESKRGRRR